MRQVINRATLLVPLIAYFAQSSFACSDTPCIGLDNYRVYQTDAVWVKNAALPEFSKHAALASAMRAIDPAKPNEAVTWRPVKHELAAGSGDVLIYRRWFKGWPMLSDSSYVFALTIVFKKPLQGAGELRVGDRDDALVFVTAGAPGFQDFCTGYAVGGTIKYETFDASNRSNSGTETFFAGLVGISRGVHVSLSLDNKFVPTRLPGNTCEMCSLNADFVFTPSSLETVNAMPRWWY